MQSLAIEGELSIYRAAELRDSLMAALAVAEPASEGLEIDLSGVTEMDSAGVQLLMAAKKAAFETLRELRLVGHSPAVIEVFETLDLAAHFGDPLLVTSPARRSE